MDMMRIDSKVANQIATQISALFKTKEDRLANIMD
jgi:hypothetical protein